MAFNISDSEWKDFEKLIFKILLDEYGIEESKINRLTQPQKDGGYDGIFYIPYFPKGDEDEKSFIRTLFEAKLRSDLSHSLPLQEFSKALIISINRNASRFIIATNLYFSQGTIDTLLEYSQNTGLEIRFFTAYDIHRWLEGKGKAIAESFVSSPDLIDFLQESYAKNQLKAQDSSQKSIYISTPDICPLKVIGQSREKAVYHVLAAFQETPGIITVEGEAGIGKSVFTNQVLQLMGEKSAYNIQKIDIEYYGTPRVLFIKMLDHVWHIPFQILNTLDEETAGDILRWIGDWEVPEEMRQTLISAFSKSAEEYHHFSDIFNYYLTEYLYQIYSIVKERKIPLLCLSNINYADEDLLRFLLLLIKKFDGKFCVLLELRTSLYIDGRVSDQAWTDFLSAIWQLPNLRERIIIKDWEPEETQTFIRSRTKSLRLPLDCVHAIQKRVGNNPLHLDTFLSYISLRIKNENIPKEYWKEYIENYPLEAIDHIIFLLIDRLARTIPHAIEVLFLMGVLEGHSPICFLERCLGYPIESTLNYLLTKTPLLWSSRKVVYVSHSLYLAAIQKYDYISVLLKQNLAESILDCLNELQLDAFHEKKIQIDMLQILNEYKKASIHALSLAEELFQDGQFQASCRYYTTARNCLVQAGTDSGEQLFRCMIGQIKSKLQLENFTEETMRQDLDNCNEVLQRSDLSTAVFQGCQIEYLIAENQFLHYFGKFQGSLDTTRKVLSLLYRAKHPDIELLGSMWAEYAIAVKETSSLENALKVFQKAEKICPASKNLRFAYLTHLSARYAAFDPKQARDYLIEIQKLEPFLNLPDRMHNCVNLATIQFYCGNCNEAQSEGKRLIRKAYHLGMCNEEGRLANLLGCIALYNENLTEAYHYFQHGIDLFQGENYVAYLWPLLANLSTLYLAQGLYQEAFTAIQQCLKIFRSSYSLRIQQSSKIGTAYEKLHIALISLTGTLHDLYLPKDQIQASLDEISEIAQGSVIQDVVQLVTTRKKAIELVCDSPFCLKKEIYIKD